MKLPRTLTLLLPLALLACCAGQASEESAPAPPGAEATNMTIVEDWIEFEGTRIKSLSAGTPGSMTVLLLHGGRFSSKTWLDLGTIHALAEAMLHVVAVDLPGFGASPATDLQRADILPLLVEAIGCERVLLVSPSMSGSFSLPFVIDHPEFVAGYVPIAPANLDQYRQRLHEIQVPTWIMWGSADTVFPLQEGEKMAAAIPGAQLSIYEGAAHPCYLDQPDRFHQELITFAREL